VDKYCLLCSLLIAAIGAIKDLRGGTVPNWLTYTGIASGLGFRAALGGWLALKIGFLGLLVGGGFFYLLFLVGGMGGGDVKLMAAVAAWAGTLKTIHILTITAMAGGVLAIIYMVGHNQVRSVVQNSLELLRHHVAHGLEPHPILNIRQPGSLRIPYGLAIAIGTIVSASGVFGWR
jgi:prepilin peptidase CpaA